jgi:triacylglycerol lipase
MRPVLNFCAGVLIACSASVALADCVVLLHGLARTSSAMNPLEEALNEAGFATVNRGYPSRDAVIQELAPLAVEEGISECPSDQSVHFVTHSLGGILVRYYLQNNELPRLGRVVMLAPPNQGSEVVDKISWVPGYYLFNGPAGYQLGTDEDSIPLNLGPVEFELGIIAGSKTVNPILSQYLENPDDGKVSVENAKVEGMDDFIVVPHSHTFLMRADVVIEQTLLFLQEGRFDYVAE